MNIMLNKYNKEKQILYDFTYMGNLKRKINKHKNTETEQWV